MEKALKDALETRAGAKVGKEEVKEWLHEVARDRDLSHKGADLDTSHQPSDGAPEDGIDPEAEGGAARRKGEGQISNTSGQGKLPVPGPP